MLLHVVAATVATSNNFVALVTTAGVLKEVKEIMVDTIATMEVVVRVTPTIHTNTINLKFVHYYRKGHLQWFITSIRSGFRTAADVPLLIIPSYDQRF
jgi:hypothetical protein